MKFEKTGSGIWTSFLSEAGYTLVETLVASALLLGVLIPAILFLGRISSRSVDRDRMVATQLARAAIERTTTFGIYQDEVEVTSQNNTEWQIERNIYERMNLVEITVRVSRAKSGRVLAELKTLRSRESIN